MKTGCEIQILIFIAGVALTPLARAQEVVPSPAPDRVAQCEAALVQAEQRAADSEQLFKEGILAKAEMEGRMLTVAEARKNLAQAREEVAAANADAAKKSFAAHQCSQADLDAANVALKSAQAVAAAATVDWTSGEIEAATLDVQRKRKLYAEGVTSKREVELAEERLAALTGTASK